MNARPALHSALLAASPGVPHAFGTAAGGFARGERRAPGAPRLRAMGCPPWPVFTARQVHGAEISVVGGAPRPVGGEVGEADGLLTRTPGLLLGVVTADCLPVLLYDEEAGAVAALHAGWRGTLAGIAARALGVLRESCGSSLRRVRAALGPAIGPCCYEVPRERVEQFAAAPLFAGCGELDEMARSAHLDLWALNRHLLRQGGVPAAGIEEVRTCTACGRRDFHSYRRDGEGCGRQLSLIGLPAASNGTAAPCGADA